MAILKISECDLLGSCSVCRDHFGRVTQINGVAHGS
jgi:hypothetical protein